MNDTRARGRAREGRREGRFNASEGPTGELVV